MNRPLLLALALLALTISPTLAQHAIDQTTFLPSSAYAPSVAVSAEYYTAIAYLTEIDGQPQAAVQLVPTNPATDDIWPDPVVFGPSAIPPRVCWSRDGFTLVYAAGGNVHAHHADHNGNWDLDEPAVFTPGGEVVGLDLWGVPSDAAGHAVFLSIDDDIDPSYDADCRVHFASRSSYSGWSDLELRIDGLLVQPSSQVSWHTGPAGPWPAIYYLAGPFGAPELFRINREETGWTPPSHIPGDGASGPTSLTTEFDVVRTVNEGIVGLGPQPTCPCGSIHFLWRDDYHWQPEEDITVNHDHYDWPFSPRIDADWNDVMHVFWYQLASAPNLEPHRDSLEYWTFEDGQWTDRGGFLDHLERGLGWRVDVGVSPDGTASVMAWSKTDTIAGEPQLEQVFMARSTEAMAAPSAAVPAPVVELAVWPNPFNPRLNLAVTVLRDGMVRVEVFDARGRRVQRVYDGLLTAGRHELVWDGTLTSGRAAPSGVYFAQVVAGGGKVVRKVVLAE